MLETWEEERHQKRSKTNAENATSDPDGLGVHRHTSGSTPHIRIRHDMRIEAGGEDPPLTAVVLKTHTKKDGIVVDKRALALVKKAEELALSRSQQSSISEEGSYCTPSSKDITAAYIELNCKNKKERVYGLGSIQYLQVSPKKNAAALLRHVESQFLMTNMQGDIGMLKEGMSVIPTMKDDINGLKARVAALLTLNGVDPITY